MPVTNHLLNLGEVHWNQTEQKCSAKSKWIYPVTTKGGMGLWFLACEGCCKVKPGLTNQTIEDWDQNDDKKKQTLQSTCWTWPSSPNHHPTFPKQWLPFCPHFMWFIQPISEISTPRSHLGKSAAALPGRQSIWRPVRGNWCWRWRSPGWLRPAGAGEVGEVGRPAATGYLASRASTKGVVKNMIGRWNKLKW